MRVIVKRALHAAVKRVAGDQPGVERDRIDRETGSASLLSFREIGCESFS